MTAIVQDDEIQEFLTTLGIRIRQLRKDKGFNMRTIMIASGYYDAQWRKYEAGGSMNLGSLMKIAHALDVSLAELLDGLAQWPRLSVAQIRENNTLELGSERRESEQTAKADQKRAERLRTTKKKQSAQAAGESVVSTKRSQTSSLKTMSDTSLPRSRRN